MECEPVLLDELKLLLTKRHPWRLTALRTNLALSKDDILVDGTWRKLKHPVYSNGVRAGQSAVGDRILAIVQEMLPHASINTLALNRNVQCGKHKDSKNGSGSVSYVLCFGDFAGGALCFEPGHPGGERFETRDVWHGPMNSREYFHWNEPILGVDGRAPMKYSIVAYYRDTPYAWVSSRRARPKHPWLAWLKRVLRRCQRRLRIVNGSEKSSTG